MGFTTAFATWSTYYADHAMIRTVIAFVHLAGLVAGGGCAIAADRATIRAWRRDAEARAGHLDALRSTHRVVVTGLAALLVSGLLLLAADFETYALSSVFWTKMLLVGLLLTNGGFIVNAERAAARGEATAWARLRGLALTSLVLWFLTTLAGAALPNL